MRVPNEVSNMDDCKYNYNNCNNYYLPNYNKYSSSSSEVCFTNENNLNERNSCGHIDEDNKVTPSESLSNSNDNTSNNFNNRIDNGMIISNGTFEWLPNLNNIINNINPNMMFDANISNNKNTNFPNPKNIARNRNADVNLNLSIDNSNEKKINFDFSKFLPFPNLEPLHTNSVSSILSQNFGTNENRTIDDNTCKNDCKDSNIK